MSTLPSLLPPTALLLSYSLPLLFTSLCLTFAGTFLTLDRTRTFPRAYDAIVPGAFDKPARPKPKDLFVLGGGVGGLVSGWCFGVHFTTFLTLLVPSISANAPFGSKSFIATWLISSVVTTGLGGRWRHAAMVFSGLTGGCLLSLLLSVLLHPSITTRLVMTAVFTPLILLLCLLPFPTIQYPTLRLANSSAGAVGVVISIALLAHEANWANVWERYWVADGDLWGSGKEKGLSAAACIFLALGIATDWFLKRKFGECPDQKWDSYLSKYAANLPDRAGTFAPARTFLDRVLHGGNADNKHKDIVFPDDNEDSKLKQGFLGAPPAYDMHDMERNARPAFLKKGRSQSSARFSARTKSSTTLSGGKKREAVKFRPLNEPGLSSDDDTDDDMAKAPISPTSATGTPQRPWLKTKSSVASSTRTLVNDEVVNYDKDIEALKRSRKKGFGDREIPDYSDGEDIADTASSTAGTRTPRKVSGSSDADSKDWSPKFLQQRRDSAGSSSMRTASSGGAATAPKPVPATPSLIKAIDRVQAAQRAAYGAPTDGLPKLEEEEVDVTAPPKQEEEGETQKQDIAIGEERSHGGWTSFWRDVEKQNKASRDVPLRSPTRQQPPPPHTNRITSHDRRS